jgi:hypothetical protein
MTGFDHRREAERLAKVALGAPSPAETASLATLAQVHATLATGSDYSAELRELAQLRRTVGNLRALLPTEPAPEQGLPNELAYANGWHGAWDMVRGELDREVTQP